MQFVNVKIKWLVLSAVISATACAAQSRIPTEMPEGVSFDYHQGGAMSRSYRKYRIDNGILEFEQLAGSAKQSWRSRVSQAEISKVYAAFVRFRFDSIENDERDGIVHDAGSEGIALSAGQGRFFRVTYGHNSPLSGQNLSRYLAARKALEDLVARHRAKAATPGLDERADIEGRIEGRWRLAGTKGRNAWFLEWEFSDGSFSLKGYPPLFQKGKYRIVNASSGTVVLELFDQSGNFGAKDRRIEVVLDAGSDQLRIDGKGGFSRAGIRKQN